MLKKRKKIAKNLTAFFSEMKSASQKTPETKKIFSNGFELVEQQAKKPQKYRKLADSRL